MRQTIRGHESKRSKELKLDGLKKLDGPSNINNQSLFNWVFSNDEFCDHLTRDMLILITCDQYACDHSSKITCDITAALNTCKITHELR